MSILHQKPFWHSIGSENIALLGADVKPPPLDEDEDAALAWEEEDHSLEVIYEEFVPAEGVLVVERMTLRLSTLTQRQLFVPPEQERAYPGVGLRSRQILERIRGYGPDILPQRRATVRALYRPASEGERARGMPDFLTYGIM